MSTAATISTNKPSPTLIAWLPLAILPMAVLLFGWEWPPWIWMWALALAVYVSLKWLSYVDCPAAACSSPWRAAAYLFFWPGMDAASFLIDKERTSTPSVAESVAAVAKTIGGFVLVFTAVRLVDSSHPLAAGWVGMIGIVFTLHFGIFHLMSVVGRRLGINAKPLMNTPILSASVSDFWGRRWNRAFRDLSHRFIHRRFHRRLGLAGATMTVFLLSGVLHDLVISVPARGGWGLPTVYFVIQGLAILTERSEIGKRLGLRRGLRGRLFAVAAILLPLPLLFHVPFVEGIVVPMLSAIGALV